MEKIMWEKLASGIFLFLVMMTATVSMAQDASQDTPQETFKYSPPGCDFKAEFPHEPGFVRRCPSDPTQPCNDVAQYTSRKDFDKTINVEMSCTVLTPEVYETYTRDNLEEIILKLVRDANLPEAPPIEYQVEAENDLKIIGTSGVKTAGYSTKIFVTQIWLTPGSLMTVEGEMSLENGPEGDKEFADILRSIMLVGADQEALEDAPATVAN